jgi:hypothetical protein
MRSLIRCGARRLVSGRYFMAPLGRRVCGLGAGGREGEVGRVPAGGGRGGPSGHRRRGEAGDAVGPVGRAGFPVFVRAFLA